MFRCNREFRYGRYSNRDDAFRSQQKDPLAHGRHPRNVDDVGDDAGDRVPIVCCARAQWRSCLRPLRENPSNACGCNRRLGGLLLHDGLYGAARVHPRLFAEAECGCGNSSGDPLLLPMVLILIAALSGGLFLFKKGASFLFFYRNPNVPKGIQREMRKYVGI